MSEAPEQATPTAGTAAAEVEQAFLVTGQQLENAIAILDRLRKRFAEYTAELTGAALGNTSDELGNATQQIAGLTDVRNADAGTLDSLRELINSIHSRIASLGPVTREMEALSVNARVVASSTGVAASDFVLFAQDMHQAAQQVRDCLLQARNALEHVSQELTATQADAMAFTERHQSNLQAIPARLAANLRSLAAERQLAADAATAAQSQSDTVRQQVAEHISALQLGDIVRQRVEHVQAALQLLRQPCRQAGLLLSSQLNGAADDLAHEGERIETGLRRLAKAARAIGVLGVKLHGETTAQGGSFVAALEADIHATAELFTAMSGDDATTYSRMSAFLFAADTLAERLSNVQSVQEDLRIVGLNATLKCGRLGAKGRSLAVVALELRACSSRFAGSTDAILRDLERLRPLAASLRDPKRRAKHAALAQAADDILVPLQRLHGLKQELAVALSELQQDADAVGELVDDAVSRFAVRHVLETTLRRTASELAAWAGNASPSIDGAAREVLDRIAAAYTMDRERAVHARFAPLPAVEPATGLDDVLF